MGIVRIGLAAALLTTAPILETASANDYRERGKVAELSGSAVSITPPRDWNKLAIRPGKFAETWTLDGEQLNDVTFYTGVEPGAPLVKERNKKRKPLPKFGTETLLVEVPELLEGTYRAYKEIGEFRLTGSKPGSYLGVKGVEFTYDYTDGDQIRRQGEAHAAIISGKLYMATYDAPTIHFFQRNIADYRALIATAKLM
jgi:hypothetical protein